MIGSSFITSIVIKIPIKKTEFFKKGMCIPVNVFNFEYPNKYELSSIDLFIF